MFGRTTEIERIAAAMRRSDLVGVVLAGEAGVGKSSVLAQAAAHAEAEGFVVVRLFGSRAAATLPLCAFSAFLEPTATDQSIERFIAVRSALAAHAGARPLLLAIDDAHLLDDSSAVLVSQMARELAAFVLCSIRTGEPAPDAISGLWVQGSATLISLEPLPRELCAQIVAEALGGAASPALEAELWRRTGGNPLFLRELALGSLASGALQQVGGEWTQVGALSTSNVLTDLVRNRLTLLSPDAQHALCCVALSEPASVGLIEKVADSDALLGLEEAGLVQVTQDRRRLVVRLSHPLYGEVIRAQTSQLRARKIRRELAAAVMAFGARRLDDALSVASWRLDCGDVDPAQFAQAAFDAMRRHDTDLAERLAYAAHEHSPSELSARALAMTRHMLGRHAEALDALVPLYETLTPGSNEWAKIALLDGLIRGRGIGDYPAALGALESVAGCSASPRTLRLAQAMAALIHLLQGNATVGLQQAATLADEGADDAEVLTALVGAMAANGRPARAMAIATSFLERNGDPDPRSLLPDFRWVALLDAGALDATVTSVAGAWEVATDVSDRHRQARAALAFGHVLLDKGQAASARRWFETAAGMSKLTGERFGERWALSGRLLASAQLGDVADADAAVAALAEIPSHPAAFFEVYGQRGMAWLSAAKGQPVQAREQLTTLAAALMERGCVAHGVRALLDLARLGDPAAARNQLDGIDERIDGDALPIFVEFVRALAASSADALTDIAERLATIGYSALAAEAASAARDALARDGRARDASGWARRAAELIAGTEGGATPLFTVIETVVPLTRREREIAALVAAGRASKEVADALFLSVRTVESHLARVYDKLGVRSRSELTEALSSMMVGEAA